MGSKKEVVLVIGSNGCLGQYIVKLLHERDDSVGEIRLFDKAGYTNHLGHSEKKKVVEFVGDIRETETLEEAMNGVDCVIHTAAVADISVVPDEKEMETVNVNGTRNIIEACLKKNVARLLFASSTCVSCGNNQIFFGSETTICQPKSFMFGKYGETKWRSEDLILKASGQLCSDGETVLRTVALRPPEIYGEGDKYFVPPILKCVRKTNGVYFRVKDMDERSQYVYVGNAAWAFVKAKEKLAVNEGLNISGEAFIITDDTPITDMHECVQPYIEARGHRISKCIIPYWFAWIYLSVISLVIQAINLVVSVDFGIHSVARLNYMCTTFFYNRTKANLRLDYQPIYTPEESRRLSTAYYKSLKF